MAAPAAAQSGVDIVGDTRIVSTTKMITGDATGDVLQTARTGKDFHIVISGLPADKIMQLELGFAELQNTSVGDRTFDVTVNEKPALTTFDIIEAAGAPLRSVVKKFNITPSGGFLDFHFKGSTGDAAINYIAVTGEGVKKLLSAPAPKTIGSVTEEEEFAVPADKQAIFDVESGTINLDSTGETWNSGLPIGGIGTGKFEVLPNGQFANFTINNSWDLPVLRPSGTFLAVAAKASSGGGSARILQVNPSDPTGKKVFEDYPMMKEAITSGEFPFGAWEMKDEKFPLIVKAEAWSPLIPYNAADSSLPGGIVSVTLENPKNYPISSAVAFSWEDLNGRGGSLLPGDQHGFSGRSTHQDAATSDVTGIQISSNYNQTDRAATFFGDYFVGTPVKGVVVTRNLNWNPRTGSIPWWKRFASRLRLDRIPATPASVTGTEKSGPTASTICVSVNLAPKEVRRIPFIVSWYFPKIVTLDSAGGNPSIEAPDYAARFGSSVGVASHLASHRFDFRDATAEWSEMIQRATVPQWVKSHALNSLFPMRSNSIYLKDDRFAMLESPADMKGMLGPVDIRMASGDFLRSMFPALEKTELNLYARAQDASGRIPRYVGNIHGALAGFDPELLGSDWVDPTASWLLQVAAYWRESGDKEFITSLEPNIIKSRNFLKLELAGGEVNSAMTVFSAFDADSNSGSMSELNVIAALRAAQKLLQEEPEEVDTLIAEQMSKINAYETTSTFAALLAGEYGLRQAGLRGLLDVSAQFSSLRSIYENNYQPFKPVPLMESTPGGTAAEGAVSFPAPLQAYVGALALSLGMPDVGMEPYLRMFQIAYAAQKAPWKQALLYDVPSASKASLRYHRVAMSAWTIWRSLSGVVHDKPSQRLYLNPQPMDASGKDMEVPVFTPDFWGWLKYNPVASTGTLSITRINGVTSPTLTSVASGISLDGTADNLVSFAQPLVLEEGATLVLDGWPGKPGGTIAPQMPELPEPAFEMTTGSLSLDDDGTTLPATDDSQTTITSKAEDAETSDGADLSPTETKRNEEDRQGTEVE